MGHCKHQWHERTEVLGAVFRESERRHHSFFVCARCLKIDEVIAPRKPAEPPRPELVTDERAA